MAGQKHLPALDGIRGLAILTVFVFHYGGGAQSPNPGLRAFGTLLHAGWTGVTLFFILSGFLISGILWDGRNTPGWWRSFYMRRTLRIFPLYYGALAIVFLSAALAGHATLAFSHIWIYLLYLQNVPALIHMSERLGSPLMLYHFWSLAVEEQFYLLWPLLLTRMKTLAQARTLCLSVFVFSAIFRMADWHLSHGLIPDSGFILARAGELAIGAWLAMCYRTPELWGRLQRLAPAAFVLFFAGFFAAGAVAHSLSVTNAPVFLVGLPSITLACAALLVLSFGKGIVNRFASSASLRWLGTISYGLYIFHVLFAPVFDWVTASLAPHAGRNASLGLRVLVAAFGSTTLAWLSFRYFETPFLRRRDHYRPSSSRLSESQGKNQPIATPNPLPASKPAA